LEAGRGEQGKRKKRGGRKEGESDKKGKKKRFFYVVRPRRRRRRGQISYAKNEAINYLNNNIDNFIYQ